MRRAFVVNVVDALLRSRMRGSTRITMLMAALFPSLRRASVVAAGGVPLYLDLRLFSAHSLFLGQANESDVQSIMRTVVTPGDVALDIGAHLGIHTVLLSQLVGPAGRVHAFEPNPAVVPLLSQTVGRLGNVSLHPLALADRSGQSDLFVPADPSMASLADWVEDGRGDHQAVSCQRRRLDDLIDERIVPNPDFVKCDVEGAEALVFAGARRCLDRVDAPILLFEADRETATGFGLSAASGIEFLRGLSAPAYRFFEISPSGGLISIETPRSAHANILGVPRSRREQVATDED